MIYIDLVLTFLKIGAFTFGGGYAMLPLIQNEVIAHKWLNMEDLINFIAISESTPGPFAVNVSTYVGMTVGGPFGALCATVGVVLPSFIIILIVAKCLDKFRKSKIISGCLSGLKVAVVSLICSSVISVGKTIFFVTGFSLHIFLTSKFWIPLIILAFTLFLTYKKIHPILIIIISAFWGIVVNLAHLL